MVKVSVIVPVYNVEAYLDRCLNSLVNQTLGEIQIIVVNDGSKDGSYQIVEKYRETNSDKIVYVEKKNGGLSDARNAGLPFANGEYIGFVDGDDYVDEAMFEKMYRMARDRNSDMIICDYYHDYGKKLIYKNSSVGSISNDIFAQKEVAWNKIVNREIIKNAGILFPVGLQYEDKEFFYKIILHVNKFDFVREPLYYYVQRSDSIVYTYNEKTRDVFSILDNVIEYYKKNNLYEKYNAQFEYRCIISMLSASFFRMVKIKDNKLRKAILNENWNYLTDNFPEWKKNYILKNKYSKLDVFIKSQNRFTYFLYSLVFPVWYNVLLPAFRKIL